MNQGIRKIRKRKSKRAGIKKNKKGPPKFLLEILVAVCSYGVGYFNNQFKPILGEYVHGINHASMSDFINPSFFLLTVLMAGVFLLIIGLRHTKIILNSELKKLNSSK